MNDTGRLIYKCRRCGELDNSTGVPSGLGALIDIECNGRTRKEWGAISATMTNIYNCKDGGLGISDLIGFEGDELIEKKRKQRKEFMES